MIREDICKSIALHDAIQVLKDTNCYGSMDIAKSVIINAFEHPKSGKWLAKSYHEVYCNQCGFDFDIMKNEFVDKMKYCPNCGAKMESRDKE